MKILLIEPSYSSRSFGLEWFKNEPLALESISAALRNRHDVKLLDMRFTDEDINQTVIDYQPDIVCVTAFTTQVYLAQDVLRKTKELDPDITTIVGGIHATLSPSDFHSEAVDIIVLGEGEYTIQEIVESKEKGMSLAGVKGIQYKENGGFIQTELRPLISDLDTIVLPDRSLKEKYKHEYTFFPWGEIACIYTSRGCTNACKFCAVWIANRGKFRIKSALRVLEELHQIEEKNVFFVDDNFFADHARSEELIRLLKAENKRFQYVLIQTGVETIIQYPHLIENWRQLTDKLMILVGFESFSEEQLGFFNKKSTVQKNNESIEIMHQNDVDIFGAFIVDPQYDAHDFEMLNEYLEQSKMIYGQYTVLTPLPGTPFYKQKKQDLVIHNYELFDCQHSVLSTRLPREDFYNSFAMLYKNLTKPSRTSMYSDKRTFELTDRIDYEEWSKFRQMLKRITNPNIYLETEKEFVLEYAGVN